MRPSESGILVAVYLLLIAYKDIEGACKAGEISAYKYPDDGTFPYVHTEEFGTAFQSQPVISYGITYFDINFQENPRAKVELDSANTTHAVFRLYTISDTKLYGLGISWIACDST